MTALRALILQNGTLGPIPDGASLDLGDTIFVGEISQAFRSHRPCQVMSLTDPSGQIKEGSVVYISGDYRVSLSLANSDETARMFAICKADIEKDAGDFYRDGTVPIPYQAQGGDPWQAGHQIWVSDVTAGLLTNRKPRTSGHFEVPVGWVLNTPENGIAYLDMGRGDCITRIP